MRLVGGKIRLSRTDIFAMEPKIQLALGGIKHDQDKVRVDLLPTEALTEIAKVLTFGAKKYAVWNWKKGFTWSRLYGATLRHLFAWSELEDRDPETGLLHLAHAGCCILFLLAHQVLSLGVDDRYKEE